MSEVSMTTKGYWRIFFWLLGLLALTIMLAFVPMAGYEVLAAYAIATLKALLIILYFMHVRYSSNLVRVFVGAAILWLLILVVLTMNDYLTRHWLYAAESWP